MEVPAARLEGGLQLRDLLAQLVMPRVAGRAGSASPIAQGPQHTASPLTGQQASQIVDAAAAPATEASAEPVAARRRSQSRRSGSAVAVQRPTRDRPDLTSSPQRQAARAASTQATADLAPKSSQIDAAASDLVRGVCHSLDQLLAGRSGSRAAIAEAILAPVARRLGVLWEDDEASFAEVSAGLGLLSRRFAALPAPSVQARGHSHNQDRPDSAGDCGAILMVAAPGDTHVFGLSVVGAAFEEAGWTVMCHPAASRAEIIELIASRWIDVLAITVSWTEAMRSVPDLVAAARLASLNPDLRVLAGGGAVAQLDDARSALHADAVAVSAVQAVALAQQMLPPRATPV